ncbi:hypothetical protein J6590_068142 [Homalodisca vitripennis]|nr:hypothetical protein J6590_068142 [Homalodisca vitripennis]
MGQCNCSKSVCGRGHYMSEVRSTPDKVLHPFTVQTFGGRSRGRTCTFISAGLAQRPVYHEGMHLPCASRLQIRWHILYPGSRCCTCTFISAGLAQRPVYQGVCMYYVQAGYRSGGIYSIQAVEIVLAPSSLLV